MRGQETTESTKKSPLSDPWAFIASIGNIFRPPGGALTVNSRVHGVYAST
jgi:hypothetical protein